MTRITSNHRRSGLSVDGIRIPGACATSYGATCGLMTPQISQSGRSPSRSFVVWRCMRCSHENHTR